MKDNNTSYNKIFINNPLYLEISLYRAKVYNRQLKHDLALKEINNVKKVAKMRRD